jgi:hypothetical protein
VDVGVFRSGGGGSLILELVFQPEDQQIAGFQSQGGQLAAVVEQVAVADRSIRALLVPHRQIELQNAVATS